MIAAVGTTSQVELLVLGTSMLLFAIGVMGLVARRNPMGVLMSVELMLNAANLLLVLAARVRGLLDAQAGALLVLVLGAAEAVVGLALALAFFRHKAEADVADPGEVHE